MSTAVSSDTVDAPVVTSPPLDTPIELAAATQADTHLQQLLKGEWKLNQFDEMLWSIRDWATRLVGFWVLSVPKNFYHHFECPCHALNSSQQRSKEQQADEDGQRHVKLSSNKLHTQVNI
jgi:hypothetical protein